LAQRGRATAKKKISNGLKNPTEKILSAGFFYPLEKSLACGSKALAGRAGFVFLQRINFKETILLMKWRDDIYLWKANC
jgi:hypothetical protein